jgi:carboxyl-terminal processing protease
MMRILHDFFSRSWTRGKGYVAGLATGLALTFLFSFGNSWEISKNLEIFSVLMRELDVYYVDEVNPGDLTRTAMESMLETLDPYTVFIPESEVENHRMSMTGRYGGIGAVVRKLGNYVTIVEPYEDSPAAKAGLMPGDKVVEVAGQSVVGKGTDDVVRLMKGQPQTQVAIKILRGGEQGTLLDIQIMREEIKSKNVPYFGMLPEQIGYIKLAGFTENAGGEVREALEKLKGQGALKGVILDLRGNPGGLLREAIHVVNVFVDRGQPVVTTRGKVQEFNRTYRTTLPALDTSMALVVLVNRGSASASEIVSGTIQDLDRGVVLGQKTFGKGLVQTTRPLVYNAQLKITTSKYYIPSGRCIQALDYKQRRSDGSVAPVPDSLRKEFKTKIGRKVYDGIGVYPDVSVKPQRMANVVRALMSNDLIFDFANRYRLAHASIIAAEQFQLTEKDYQDFLTFISDKKYDYTTESEKMLERFKETATKEQYFGQIEAEFNTLTAKKRTIKKEDVLTFRSEIERLLRLEIVARYYFRKGRIASEITDDPEVREAVKILLDAKRYQQILSPEFTIRMDEGESIDPSMDTEPGDE